MGQKLKFYCVFERCKKASGSNRSKIKKWKNLPKVVVEL